MIDHPRALSHHLDTLCLAVTAIGLLGGCDVPESPKLDPIESSANMCGGELVLLETLPRSQGKDHYTRTLDITEPGEYCFTIINLAEKNVSSLALDVDGEAIFAPSHFNANVDWVSRPHALEAGSHELEARVRSNPDAEVALAVFSDFIPGERLTLTPAGGEFQVGDVEISVPPGAVDQDTDIDVRVIEPEADDPVLGPIVWFGPLGTEFNVPLIVRTPLDEDRLQPGRPLSDIEGWLDYAPAATTVDEDSLVVTTEVEHFTKLTWYYSTFWDPFTLANGDLRVVDYAGVVAFDFSTHWNPFIVYRVDLTNPYLRVRMLASELAPEQGEGVYRLQTLMSIAEDNGVKWSNLIAVNAATSDPPAGEDENSPFGVMEQTHYDLGQQFFLRTDSKERHYKFTRELDGPSPRVKADNFHYDPDPDDDAEDAQSHHAQYQNQQATVFASSTSILLDGEVQNGVGVGLKVPLPRTAVGLSEDKDYLFLLVAGGNHMKRELKAFYNADEFRFLEVFGGMRGLTAKNSGQLIKRARAHDAAFADGGSSTSALEHTHPVNLHSGTNADLCGGYGCPVINMLAVTHQAPPITAGVIVDDEDPGFSIDGTPGHFVSYEGYRNGAKSMRNVGSEIEDTCIWSADLAAGNYEVFVFVPQWGGETQSAPYRIKGSGVDACASVDQLNTEGEWASLGVHAFSGPSSVELSDVTGEPHNTQWISCDAVWFKPTQDTPNGQACDAQCEPTIESVSPTTATLNQTLQFTATGSCLPPSTKPWIADCEDIEVDHWQESQLLFSCTPSYTTGDKDGVIRDKAEGKALKWFTLTVN